MGDMYRPWRAEHARKFLRRLAFVPPIVAAVAVAAAFVCTR